MHPAPIPLSRRGLLAAALLLLPLAGCASAARPLAGLATLEVVDRESGQPVQAWYKDGRPYVPGRPGSRYALRLRNLGGTRVLVVLSVDGVNVISGETADWRQVGYVLDPGRSYDINGWRKSGTEVAAFEFAPIERSYAALTGRPGNVGVIGMAVFRERPAAPPIALAQPADRPRLHAESAAPAPATPGAVMKAAPEQRAADDAAGTRLGTGHGAREWSVSQRVAFERASPQPEQVTELVYDSAERLLAAGVLPPGERPQLWSQPRAFPGQAAGYVPDPPLR